MKKLMDEREAQPTYNPYRRYLVSNLGRYRPKSYLPGASHAL